MKRLAWLSLAFALSLDAQTDDHSLLSRLGNRYSCAIVYSRHASGRPRIVVGGVDSGHFDRPGELTLIRLPDTSRRRGAVIDRLVTDAGVMELSFVRLIDRRDIGVVLHVEHVQGITVRVHGGKLVEIAGVLAFPQNVIDLDGAGIPELITFCCHNNNCGMPGPLLLRWNGTEYESDGKRYASMTNSPTNEEFEAPAFRNGRSKHYVLHLYGEPRATVFIDDEPIPPGKPFHLEEDCHTIRVSARKGATAYAFVEERGDTQP